MSIKRLTATPEVLEVLRAMDFHPQNGGFISIIVGGQLDRSLYVAVNKFLEAMGGKWNRNAKGHVFPDDPRPQVDGLVDTGKIEVDNQDFFSTPPDISMKMIDWVLHQA
jgi:hypothetical protein